MENSDLKILLVDDEPDILEILEFHLKKEGYKVKTAQNGLEGIEKAKKSKPDLIVLDIMMPEMNGIEVCQELRSSSGFEDTIIVFLSARSEDFTQITALDSGGDGYIVKPIKPNIFKSKINAYLRRKKGKEEEAITQSFGDLTLNHEEICVKISDKVIPLAKKEFELLVLLTSKPGKVFKRHKIMEKVWGEEVIVGDRTIDVHIRKLREKIGSDYIKTLKGIGYKFEF